MILTYTKVVILDKLTTEILTAGLPLSYLTLDGTNALTVVTTTSLTSQQITTLNNIVNAHSTAPTSDEVIAAKIQGARDYGNYLASRFAKENVANGITQAGKTRTVTTYCHKLEHYLTTGSLYAAIDEINDMLNDGLNRSLLGLSPFVTDTVLNRYKTDIQNYLAS